MGTIKDRQMALGTIYERFNNDGSIIHKTGAVGFVSDYEDQTYFLIHDVEGNLIREANYYLNKLIGNSNYKKRELAFTALKLFYSFVQLFHIKDYKSDLTYEHVSKLLLFLEGGNSKGIAWDLEISTSRRNSTVSTYLSVYRDFYKRVFREEDNPLFDKATIGYTHGKGVLGHTKRHALERYKVGKPTLDKSKYIPKYIKQQEYEEIMKVIDEEFTLRDRLIVKLMYEYGMRLGEVLGLTFEDIEPTSNEYYRLIIRNRLSDKPYQSAKGLMQINSINDYDSPSYTTYKYGLQVILVVREVGQLLDEYIDESRDVFLLSKSPKKSDNLYSRSIADRVSSASLLNDENQYLFLSHQNYTPLSSSGWNYIIRKIFKIVGIETDSGVRQNNLSHRFRHGFAMYKVSQGYSIEKLAEAMRHSSIESCRAYYNPDEEDIASLLNKNDEHLKERYNFE